MVFDRNGCASKRYTISVAKQKNNPPVNAISTNIGNRFLLYNQLMSSIVVIIPRAMEPTIKLVPIKGRIITARIRSSDQFITLLDNKKRDAQAHKNDSAS